MRFFIALEIPPESKQQLEIVQEQLMQLLPEARLTNPEKLHLTIAFIGEQPDQNRDNYIQAMEKAVAGIPAFSVTPAYIDAFPNLHNPHTFWVAVKGDIDKLHIVRERIKDQLEKVGAKLEDRRYVPHIAIAKVHNLKLTPLLKGQLEEITADQHFQPIKICSIKLFESIPQEGFHQHNTLGEAKLQQSCLVETEPS